MVSFVIPARNESGSLGKLVTEIQNVCEWNDYAFEIILIDDGSIDGTWNEISRLTSLHSNLHGIRFRRNFGKGPALAAGFKATKGDIVFTMDADLQDNPEDIPHFINALDQGLDVVVGWRKTRRDTWHKRLLSKIFNAAVGWTGLRLHDHNCGFKCFRSESLRGMYLYGDMHRYMPILAHINGFRIGEVQVHHRNREFGRSNYGMGRTYRGFFDLITILFLKSFRHRPLHLLGSLGVSSLLLGLAGLSYLGVLWLLGEKIGGRPLIIYSAAIAMFGSQVLATGVLAELLTAYMARYEVLYSVKDTVGATNVEGLEKKDTPLTPYSRPERSPSPLGSFT